MKINISDPFSRNQKNYILEDSIELIKLQDKRVGQIIDGSLVNEVKISFIKELKNCIVLLTGGFDGQGFAMRKDFNEHFRIKKRLKIGTFGFKNAYKRKGCVKSRSFRGSLITTETSCLNGVMLSKDLKLINKNLKSVTKLKYPKRLSRLSSFFFNVKSKNRFMKILYAINRIVNFHFNDSGNNINKNELLNTYLFAFMRSLDYFKTSRIINPNLSCRNKNSYKYKKETKSKHYRNNNDKKIDRKFCEDNLRGKNPIKTNKKHLTVLKRH